MLLQLSLLSLNLKNTELAEALERIPVTWIKSTRLILFIRFRFKITLILKFQLSEKKPYTISRNIPMLNL